MASLLAALALALLACDDLGSRVAAHQDVIIKYIAQDLCKVPFTNVAFVQASLLDQSTLLNHQSTCSYDCMATASSSVTDITKRALGSGLIGGHAVRELTSDIKDKTTPDITVQKILSARVLA